MAICWMTDKDEKDLPCVKTVTDYPGSNGTLYMKTEYAGCILEVYEHNGYDDSDFYAIAWDEKEDAIRRIEYASTRGWSYPNSATVDATPEIRNQALAHLRRAAIRESEAQNVRQSKEVKPDRLVRVVKGRKVALGTTGRVCWIGKMRYGASEQWRVGLMVDGQCVFTARNNCEVVNPNDYLVSADDLQDWASRVEPNIRWDTPVFPFS